ncbi:hypothetical protein [Undibacterium oligocarboniphilum]|uniref:Uncharacterized protein n=1 Tax=Undibacterium oligocarboniphilum TaxID=666702 RepID=A0A850QI50_9BURK|nr:hypothetical protein [Undibacterium oligocarboniphilum]MBC3871456.1 hypothetical protein [Undibacterium oligocarboniphilum]NVO78968.1 hypothetical protein [Undibacterium oligocarboniphilum]
MQLGSLVEIVKLIGPENRSLGGLSPTVAIGDRGVVAETYAGSKTDQQHSVRVVSKTDDGTVRWEANFREDELKQVAQ